MKKKVLKAKLKALREKPVEVVKKVTKRASKKKEA